MSDLTKNIEEKRAQTEEVINEFLSQTEPPKFGLEDTSEQTDGLVQAFDITRRMAKVYTSE